jgi:DNA-binding CsgD family transcriptional regulator/tetratricopeptide (TPR) repeat protein
VYTFGVLDELERGRESYRRRAFRDAYDALCRADQECSLAADDLERLAMAAYQIGRDDEFLRALDRAHHIALEAGERARAARFAFWLGLHLMLRGEAAPANGWLGRAKRLLRNEPRDCVEAGYLHLPEAEQHLALGECQAAYASAARAAEIGDSFGDADLTACARHIQGRALMEQGQMGRGLALLDEAMVAVTASELSPLMTGLIYCSVIDACQRVYAIGRAREWTSAMARWCAEQPQMLAFSGICSVHRVQILQLQGNWQDALDEARTVCERFSRGISPAPAGAASYQQGEVHRLRGDFAAAEEAYAQANLWGCEPQPGLALLRLAQGRSEVAVAAMRRVLSATTDRLARTKFLPAHIEIALANHDVEEARRACLELEQVADVCDSDVVRAMAAQSRGAVELAEGDAQSAIVSLRCARLLWEQLQAPYPAARVRELTGLACRALGDEDGERLELAAARAVFERMDATPDLARVAAVGRRPSGPAHGLTPREVTILRLVAAGKTNKIIARELSLSEKTVERHIGNIFAKLAVPTRAAATAYAYEHRLV